MSRTISITLDAKGLSNAVEYLHRIETILPQAVKNASNRIAEEAKLQVEMDFNTVRQPGNELFSVRVESTADGDIVIAEGADVMFLEFGAGAATTPDMFAEEAGVLVAPGAWSYFFGTGEYAKYGSWHYQGNKYKELTPTHGMQNAYEWIQANGERILREELDKLL